MSRWRRCSSSGWRSCTPINLDWRTATARRGPWRSCGSWPAEGPFPDAQYAFDQGVLTLAVPRLMERGGNQWGRELEIARPIQWPGDFRRVDAVAGK